jgi:hypothetical protein|tara:strand:+ start:19658 stop:20122 length:465 start_codon:yes stop_codon:yes gene_type:complete
MQFNPMKPLAGQIMNHTMNPHNEGYHNPVTGRDPTGMPIRDQVYETSSTGHPLLESRVTGRTPSGHPIATPVYDLTRTPTYGADNLSKSERFIRDFNESVERDRKEERERKHIESLLKPHTPSLVPTFIATALPIRHEPSLSKEEFNRKYNVIT